MSDTRTQARKDAVEYLSRQLRRNPMAEGDDIIRVRSAALKLKSATIELVENDAVAVRDQRRQLLERLEFTRSNFWTMPAGELKRALAELNGCPFPDIRLPVERLRVLAAHRARLPKLSESRDFDGDLFRYLKQVFTDPPRDVAVLKEQVLSTFRNRDRRKRGRRMVKLLERELPEVYALEADWFRTLQRQKPPAQQILVSGGSRTTAGTSGLSTWWVWIAIAIISAVIRNMSRH